MVCFNGSWLCVLKILMVMLPWIFEYPITEQASFETSLDPMANYRLPNSAIPRFYRIHIEPNMDDVNLTWTGISSIDVEILVVTRNLTLHAHKNLVIDESYTELVDPRGQIYKPIGQIRNDDMEFLEMNFSDQIMIGNYTLNLKYEGVEIEDGVGFYKASLPDKPYPNVAATKFQATRARQAFPCWDEPALKANFQISIEHLSNYTALSNMPEKEHAESGNGKIITTFHTTPLMSTYLLNLIIGDYDSITNEYENVTVWASDDVLDDFRYMLNFSQQVVDVMESYTGLSFGVPRLGIVMIPKYPSVATEHWGLISLWVRNLIVRSNVNVSTDVDYAKHGIAHEISHGWFGNRVSPLWWNDLWLNEGFAEYFQYYILDQIYDNWGGLERFIVSNNQESSFWEDESETDIYVRWVAPSSEDMNNRLFGVITYRKAAAIIHMFRNVLTDDVFRVAIRNYLNDYSFKSVDADDLIRALQAACDKHCSVNHPVSINDAMKTWLMQTGYPMINITRNYTTGDIRITQSTLIGNDSNKKWWVPLSYATQTDLNFLRTTPSEWISNVEDGATIVGINKNDWVLFNVQANGYYRVNYDDENWDRLVKYLNTDDYDKIHVLNRAQLVDDSYYLWDRDLSQYSKVWWELTKYLSREIKYPPWYAAKRRFMVIDFALTGSELLGHFRNHTCELMNSFIEKVGFETHDDDDHVTKLSKQSLVGWACNLGHSGCVKFSAQKLLRLIENPLSHRLHPDNKIPIVCAGLRGLNDTSIHRVVKWLIDNEKSTLDVTIGCSNNREILMSYLISEIQKNSTSLVTVIRSMLYTTENYDFVVDFFVEYHETLKTILEFRNIPDGLFKIVEVIDTFTGTEAQLKRLEDIHKLDAIKNDEEIQEYDFVSWTRRGIKEDEKIVANVRTWFKN